jgi:hypothetical protein
MGRACPAYFPRMANDELSPAALRDRLARFPDALRAAASVASPQDARWKPAPEHWSILEVCCHLLDEEREDFRVRAASTLRDPTAPWPPLELERVAERRRYQERDLRAVLDEFAAERAASIAWLDATLAAGTPPQWTRAMEHPRFGPLAAGMLLASWAAHDALHLRQIAKRLHELSARDAGPYEVRYAGDW